MRKTSDLYGVALTDEGAFDKACGVVRQVALQEGKKVPSCGSQGGGWARDGVATWQHSRGLRQDDPILVQCRDSLDDHPAGPLARTRESLHGAGREEE